MSNVPQQHQHVRLLRFKQVRERVALSRSTIARLHRRGDFPRPIRITENTIGWAEHEIDSWLRRRIDGTDGGAR
jgi:prophage regulatory protein